MDRYPNPSRTRGCAREYEAAKTEKGRDAITLCANSRGKPWTGDGFSCSFRKAIQSLREMQLVGDGVTFHGLRRTVVTELAERGVNEGDIAAVPGQRTSKMAAHYARDANRSRRTKAAIKKFQPLGGPKEVAGQNKK